MNVAKIVSVICISLVTVSAQAQQHKVREVKPMKQQHKVCLVKHRNHVDSNSPAKPGPHIHRSKASDRQLKVGVKSPRQRAKIKAPTH